MKQIRLFLFLLPLTSSIHAYGPETPSAPPATNTPPGGAPLAPAITTPTDPCASVKKDLANVREYLAQERAKNVALTADLTSKQTKLVDVEKQLGDAKSKLASLEKTSKDTTAAQQDIQRLKNEVSGLHQTINTLKGDIQRRDANIDLLTRERNDLITQNSRLKNNAPDLTGYVTLSAYNTMVATKNAVASERDSEQRAHSVTKAALRTIETRWDDAKKIYEDGKVELTKNREEMTKIRATKEGQWHAEMAKWRADGIRNTEANDRLRDENKKLIADADAARNRARDAWSSGHIGGAVIVGGIIGGLIARTL